MSSPSAMFGTDLAASRGTGFRPELLGSIGVEIKQLETDSRKVKPGDTFVAYPGAQADGRQFIGQAIANGANAVIYEAHGFAWNDTWQLPRLAVSDLRHHAGEIASHVYGEPSSKLWMVGVTGTNGKTSCSHWIAQSFSALEKKSALLGTLGNGFPGDLQPTLNTTPDAVCLHRLLAEYREQGAQAAAMEVSSHALAQGRVNGVQFDVALFTNLSRDHLDYHGDMQHYAAAKRSLFDLQQLKHVVLNLDDAFGADLAEQLRDGAAEVVGYGLTESALKLAESLGLRMVYGGALHAGAQGIALQIHSSWGGAALQSALLGRFNAANLLAVLAVLLVSGIELPEAVQQLERVTAVPGRMQTYGGAGRPTVVVDYAHTPDALEKVLQALREIVETESGKLICVFGCGGDRDRGKRPMMGTVASRLADICIVTSDNPRGESPHDIIAAIASGISGPFLNIENRAAAIAHAVGCAEVADTVLVAGKGHEPYQEIGGEKYPFSDAGEVQRALASWRAQA